MNLKTFLLSFYSLVAMVMAARGEFDHNYDQWAQTLRLFAVNGQVDYESLKAEPKSLKGFLSEVTEVKEREFNLWPRDFRMAFLLNVYNAYTLQLVIDHYPVESLRKIGGRFNGPYKLPGVKLFDKALSLDTLKNDLLLKEYNEPTLHFALVNGTRSSPLLRGEPYMGNRLKSQLEDQTRRFIRNSSQNRVDLISSTLFLSSLFKESKTDFTHHSDSLKDFVANYFPEDTARLLKRGDFSIKYLPYSWDLNDLPDKTPKSAR